MYAIKAIYDGTNFKPTQPIPVTEDYEVVITFIEPVKKDTANVNEPVRKIPCAELCGILKGKVWMSDDFNEPLEEMKEYME
jgi:predicted DNA-binding antitoxin AbrB/MazE fold protein